MPYETFKVEYHDVLQMRRKYDDFNDFLVREATGANFRRLKALREQLSDEEILAAMRSGALADVIALTDRQFEHVQNIITATGSFDTAFRWLQIARDRLPLVVDARLYEFVPLDRMPQELISRILRWSDIKAIRSLGSVPQQHYNTLSKMTDSQWKLLLGAGDSSEKISKHLALVSILDQANTNMLLQGAHRTPGRIDFLFGEREILGELDADQQLEVLDFVLRSSFSERLQSLFSGSQRGIMLRYFWLLYWWVVVAFLIVIVVAVPLVRRVTGRAGGQSVES
uniref:F-box domain-containing protein n=1 Tax=Candidatus Kentrum sp. LPFa TaxID=2126335 RepID=A0A450VNC5_9GAMM|nr:MAG: hypothetical protein BECKLPF1236A_GA0070988_1000231 [Candidatus Kentron sp. LPFa]VFK23522.1 MAG: hypothetical protein BECKLPF1236C_GA0070990_1000613 [Candidatus Kentron sp. LPFa]